MSFSRIVPGRLNRRGIPTPSSVAIGPINFATLFSSPYQSVQTDLGFTYGSTMLASGSAPPPVGLAGSTSATATPIQVTIVGAGGLGVADFRISRDGGLTFSQTGVTAASVPISGLPGLSVTFTNAAYNGDEVYLATCSAIADQSGNGLAYAQAVASLQPVVTVGLNGFPGLLFDGIDDILASALTLPAPGTTPGSFFFCGRAIGTVGRAWSPNGANGGYGLALSGASLQQVSGLFGNFSSALATNTFGVVTGFFGNSAANDYIRAGSGVAVMGTSAGNTACTTMQLGGRTGNIGKFELLALVFAPGVPPEATVRAAALAKYGAIAA